jgi:hypothetical protein
MWARVNKLQTVLESLFAAGSSGLDFRSKKDPRSGIQAARNFLDMLFLQGRAQRHVWL